jgi:TonB family protein
MLAQRYLAVGLLLALAVPGIASAQLEQRLRVWSCTHADSLLGPIGLDTAGVVFLRHAGTPDTAFYRTGPAYRDPGRPRFTFFMGVEFAIPGVLPDAEGYVIFHDNVASRFTKYAIEPRAWIVLDDAPPRRLPLVLRGTSVGPADGRARLPVTVGFLSADLLAIARATRTVIRIEDVDVVVSKEDRADVRALIRNNVCPTPKNAERDYVEVYRPGHRPFDTTNVSRTEGTFFEWQVEEPVSVARGTFNMRYPDALRRAYIEGEVLAQFEVDTTGRADMTTFKALRSSHSGFTTAVRDYVVSAQFNPAMRNGQRVRQLVRQPFNFTLTR